MTENQLPPQDKSDAPSPMPLLWRIAIAAVALIVIIALAWQYLPARNQEEVPPPAADTNNAIANENSSEALFQLGNDAYKSGQWDAAVAAYKKAIELNPNYDAAYANLGAVYYAQQKLDLAEEAYKQAISLSPNDADVTYNLGAIYLQQALSTGVPDPARLNDALTQINKAVELNPKLAEPYYGLGVANQLLGNNDEAIRAFQTFLDLDDGSDPIAASNATKILQELKAGQGK